jgi:hypothetical protein
MTPTVKTFLQLAAVLVVLAAAGVLAVTTATLSGTEVYALVGFIAGGTAVAGGIALTATPANVIPHIILILAVLGLTIAMAEKSVFGNAEVTGVFTFIVGGGVLGAGSNIITTKLAKANAAHEPPAFAPGHPLEVPPFHPLEGAPPVLAPPVA